MILLQIASVTEMGVVQWEIFNLSMITKKEKTMKKVIFATLTLAIGLWSCSQDEEIDKTSDGYVDVTIGTQSGSLRSIVAPGGATSWNLPDKVKVLDVDGVEQVFSYAAETPKSSAQFAGRLKSGQGKQIYHAYHTPEKSKMTLKDGHILIVGRENAEITEDKETINSILFGAYCPMVATPFEFDAENTKDPKLVQFYHLGTMIEGRVSLRNPQDSEFLDRTFDKIVFEVKAIGSEPFYTEIQLDLNKLTTSSSVEDLNECIVNSNDKTVKTNFMSTTMNMHTRSIRNLMEEHKLLGSFAIPIFALPTEDSFNYTATISFYNQDKLQLKLEGSNTATKLNPAGLNILNFDYKKIVN